MINRVAKVTGTNFSDQTRASELNVLRDRDYIYPYMNSERRKGANVELLKEQLNTAKSGESAIGYCRTGQ